MLALQTQRDGGILMIQVTITQHSVKCKGCNRDNSIGLISFESVEANKEGGMKLSGNLCPSCFIHIVAEVTSLMVNMDFRVTGVTKIEF